MGERFQFRSLGLWGRPITDPRAASRFKVGWTDTIKQLVREVDLLDGGRIAVQVDVPEARIRRDGMLYAQTRIDFPSVKVSFDSRHGPLTYATDAFDRWQANVRAIALALEALRAVDRYGVSGSGEQYRGWTAIASKPAEKTLSVDDAAAVLAQWMVPVCRAQDMRTEDQAARAYRAAVQVHHPDKGGNADAFRLITSARDVLVEAIRAGAR